MTPAELAAIHARSFITPRPWSEDEIADILSTPNTHLFIAPHGFAISRIAGPEAELLTIAVDPDHRRLRIGKSLIDMLIADAKSAGVEELFLEVAANNSPAQKLYQFCGFRTRATRKDYYSGPNGQKISAIVMALAL